MPSPLPRGLRLGLVAAASLAAAVALLALLALDRAPALPAAQATAPLVELRRIVRARLPAAPAGARRQVTLPAAELERLATGGANAFGLRLALQLGPGTLRVQMSAPWRIGPWELWLNADATWGQTGHWPALQRARLGALPLPPALTEAALRALAARRLGDEAWQGLERAVREIVLAPEAATLTLQWTDGPLQDLVGLMQPTAARGQLAAYEALLHGLLAEGRGAIELPALMAPMAALAAQRSADGAEPAAENRAWLQVLTRYVQGRGIGPTAPARAPRRPVLLAGRGDFPLHFMVSALLAAEAGAAVADAMGLAKEVDDARHGSGFSFTDIAVNRAGQRLGTLARDQPSRLQQRLTDGTGAELLPAVDDLPEFLAAAEFERRFGGVDAPAFARQLAVIDARLDALPLYR